MHVLRFLTFITLFLILIAGCTSKKHELFYKNGHAMQTAEDASNTTPKQPVYNRYRIKTHDRLSIVFFEYPELSTKSKDVSDTDVGIEVHSDGTIVMPLIGKIFVAGLSKEMLTNLLYKKYSSYLEKPALRVEVLNQKIYVLGEVKNPGAIDLMKYRAITPLKAIVVKGGLTDFAQRDTIKVVRGDREHYKIITIDMTDMRSIMSYNIDLLPDDVVYIAHNSVKDFNLPLNGANASLSWINTLFSTLTLYQAFK